MLIYRKRKDSRPKVFRGVVTLLLLTGLVYGIVAQSMAAKTSEQYLDEATLDFSQGHYRSAAKSYRKALKVNPTEPHAYLGLSMALKAEGKLGESLAILSNLVELYPNFAPAYYNLGEVKEAQGDMAGAKQAYKHYIELQGGKLPPSPEIRIKFRKMGLL